jgi:hypothetical protein
MTALVLGGCLAALAAQVWLLARLRAAEAPGRTNPRAEAPQAARGP